MSDPASTVRHLPCPQCGGTVALRAEGSSVSLICEFCGSTLDATNPDLKVIQATGEALRRPQIRLGRRGTIRGIQWEVVGYLERRPDEGSRWSEYLLFNPYAGYAFLVDDGRRFHLGRLIDHLPYVEDQRAFLDGDEFYEVEPGYWTEVTFVVGEFYWRVAVGERVYVCDYARHDAMLSTEQTESEQTWTQLALLNFGEAERAFNLRRRRESTARHAPPPDETSPWRAKLWEVTIIAIAAFFALLIVNAFCASTTRAAAGAVNVVLDGPEANFVIHGIDVGSAHTKVSITADGSALSNAWVDVDYSLVEQKTQESYDAYGLAEFYSGRDSDGYWTEGNRQPETRYATVPRGRYDLLITASAHSWPAGTPNYVYNDRGELAWAPDSVLPVSFVVRTGGTFIENFWIAAVLILIWPAWVWYRHCSFIQRRDAGL